MAAYRYWRVLIKAPSPDNNSADTITMASTPGGTNLATNSAKASASTTNGGFVAGNAIAGVASFWASTVAANWWKYDFDTPVDIREISWKARSDGFHFESPVYAIVQGSNDNSTWVDEWTLSFQPWSSGQTQTCVRPALTNEAGGHRYWRIYVATTQGGSHMGARTIEMRQTPGGPNIALNCLSGASSQQTTNPVRLAFDAFDASVFGTQSPSPPHWISADFGPDRTPRIVEWVWSARNDAFYAEAPTSGDVQWSDDNVNWTTLWSFGGITWTMGETKILTALLPPENAARSRVIWFG